MRKPIKHVKVYKDELTGKHYQSFSSATTWNKAIYIMENTVDMAVKMAAIWLIFNFVVELLVLFL